MLFGAITLFRSAGATGHVFLLNNGRVRNKGLAYSGFIGPKTTVAVVPTTPQIINFAIEAKTKDKQDVTVSGSLMATLTPSDTVSTLDFTVNPKDGSYVSQWEQILHAKIIEYVLRAILAHIKTLDVEEATHAQDVLEDCVLKELQNAFDGITVTSCSIPKIEPDDEQIGSAIGAREREAMLTSADNARHTRQIQAVTNAREVKKYEAETALKLEEERARLLEQQGKNKEAEATADANATKIRLAPLENVEAGKLLGAAIMEVAKTGKFGSVNLTSEFLAAVGPK